MDNINDFGDEFPLDAVNNDIDIIDTIYADAFDRGDTLSEENENLDLDINYIE
jgi:hypothetical protein